MATARVRSRQTARSRYYEQLFRDMKYCPKCGEEVFPFKTDSSFKTCPNACGTLSIVEGGRNNVTRMQMEIIEEED